jgi:hypothetical protein
MKIMKLRLLILVCLFGATQCATQKEIDESYVSHIVKTLSADAMMGREAFTPGADLAADFLSKEFETSELGKFPGLTSYKQDFDMYSLATASVVVQINGDEVAADNIFAVVDQEELTWDSRESVRVMHVGESERLPDVFRQASGQEEDVLILVHTSHKEMFERYKQYFSRNNPMFELDQEKDIVVVMTDQVELEEMNVSIKNKVSRESLTNVIGVIPGKRSEEIILFSGHYDHLGYQPTIEGDSIANGANDDASGVAAVMALAKYFNGYAKPERTLYFVAFAAEEMGGFGSQYFSKQLNPDHVVAMFNIEMIGKPAVSGPNSAWITGFDKSDFGQLLQQSVEGTVYEFYADPYPDQNLFYRSDNATLARLGVPAHSISTTPIDVDKDYHQVSDEYETLNMAHLTNTVKAIAKAAEGMVSGESTPTRVDKSSVD